MKQPLLFLLAIKHPQSANNWRRVEDLFSTTLHSLVGQTLEEFKIVVVCNQKPRSPVADDRVHFHIVDFPPVKKVNGYLDHDDKFLDKGSKYLSGLLYSARFKPAQVFICDSDDWVNRRLAETILRTPSRPVSYVDKGYFVNLKRKEFKKRRGLLRYCGSTFSYNYDYLMQVAALSKKVGPDSTQSQLAEATTPFFLR